MLMQAWALIRGQKRVLPRGSRGPPSARHVLGSTLFNGLLHKTLFFPTQVNLNETLVVFKEHKDSNAT
jgi:hypothetical protein